MARFLSSLSASFIRDNLFLLLLVFLSLLGSSIVFSANYESEIEARDYLKQLNQKLAEESNKLSVTQWNYFTNLTEYNKQKLVNATSEFHRFEKQSWETTVQYMYKGFRDPLIKRQFAKLSILGTAALGEKSKLVMIHSAAFRDEYVADVRPIFCHCYFHFHATCMPAFHVNFHFLYLTDIMANDRDFDTLKEVWINWRNATGKKMRPLYLEYIKLGNEAAVKNSVGDMEFKDYGEYWLYPWEEPDFKQQIADLWEELKGFYQKLHAYVRMKLRAKYPGKLPEDGTIPAHLLGNMWSQSWVNLLNEVVPYPNQINLDVTQEMKNQGYTAKKMFELSDEFFTGLGLERMPPKFWQNSMLTKPADREVVCHASAWDFSDGEDFRIKQCTETTMDHLVTVHHEMGHIEYYLLYKDQPTVFHGGANPGFHEAIGDSIALSVSTPSHLQSIGLLKNYKEDEKVLLNYQMQMALEKVAFLPFGYLIDLWRWDVFSGKIKEREMNRMWWELRLKYQGVSPPNRRSEEDFDPGCKYHVPGNTPYIRYFVAHILQFQFHKALCEIADNRTELYKCDIKGNKEAGKKLRNVLSKGSSVPWPDQLEELTRSRRMSAQPMLKYFEPLIKYLDQALVEEPIGWESAKVGDYFNASTTSSINLLLLLICASLAFILAHD